MSIISPWLFYLIGILDNLNKVSSTIFLFSFIGTALSFVIFFIVKADKDFDFANYIKKFIFKPFLIIFIISSLFITFVPSKENCYQMLIAKTVTYENVDKAYNIIIDSVDYIMNAE